MDSPPPPPRPPLFQNKARSFLSRHALDRAKERVKVPPEELLKICEFRQTVLIAEDRIAPHKEHHLFYDPIANECFIMVIDPIDQEVVTILPLHYRQNGVYISPATLAKARKIMARAVRRGLVDLPAPGPDPTYVPSDRSYRIKITYKNPEGELIFRTLKGWKHLDHPYPLAEFARQPEVLKTILRWMTKRRIDPACIELIEAKNGHGEKAEKEPIPVARVLEFQGQ